MRKPGMDIWLDTTNIQTIQQAVKLGLLAGVTTNPTLIAQSKKSLKGVVEDLLHHQEGFITVQVVTDDVEEIVQQGQNLHLISNRLITKVPLTKNGLEAIHLLSRQGIPTMATLIFHPHQALMAALAGADYVAPYVGRLEKMGGDPWAMLRAIKTIFQTYQINTQILAASLHSIEHVIRCAEIGVYGVTVKDEIFGKLIATDSSTLKGAEQFAADWQTVKGSIPL